MVVYAAAQLATPAVLALTMLLLVGGRNGWLLAFFGAAIGYLLPGVFIARQIERRKTEIRRAGPRTHAETSRPEHRRRAEERTAKVGVKLVFPLVLFSFPALYVVILGPAVIQSLRIFRPITHYDELED